MNKNLVSVIIPTFGRSEYLLRALNSVINQTYPNIEIIIVDDNGLGTPNQIETHNKLKFYLDSNKNIKYIIHKNNLNGSAARNTGISNSIGQFISFLDDDDEFEVKKIEMQFALLKSLDSEWKACYTGHSRYVNQEIISIYKPNKSGDILFDILIHSIDACTGSSLMVKKELLQYVKGFDIELQRHQDYDFIVRVAYHCKISVVEEPLVRIHIHGGNYSQKNYTEIINTRNQYYTKIKPFTDKLDPKQKRSIEYSNNLICAKTALKFKKFNDFWKYYLRCKKPVRTACNLVIDAIVCFVKRIKINWI